MLKQIDCASLNFGDRAGSGGTRSKHNEDIAKVEEREVTKDKFNCQQNYIAILPYSIDLCFYAQAGAARGCSTAYS